MVKVSIYIDGSCSGNPGPGGWAAICVENGKIKKCDDKIKYTTNNGAELLAAIGGLKALRCPCEVTFYTDSAYLISNANHNDEYLIRETHKNHELWLQYIKARDSKGHKITFVKVKGHSGNKLNEMADKYAKLQCAIARSEAG